MKRKTLFIEARNFGDAIIKNTFIAEYAKDHPTEEITVFCKPQFKAIFASNPAIANIQIGHFPIAGMKSWNMIELFKELWQLRKHKYYLGIDLVGDFRERLLLLMIAPKRIVSPTRDKNHPFENLVRGGLERFVDVIEIPSQVVNYYRQLDYILQSLGGRNDIFISKSLTGKKVKRVGIHPFASQGCKKWTWECWDGLCAQLNYKGVKIYCFCTPKELSIAKVNLKQEHNITFVAGDLDEFLTSLKTMDLLIGLDSFSVHAANGLGVPSIMLNGANNYKMWQPPLGEVVLGKHNCPYWPCYNKPKCKDYICITSIKVADVMTAVDSL